MYNPVLFLLIFSAFVYTGKGVKAQPVTKLSIDKKIGPDNGLSSYNASKILQDKYGFTWIATQDGLNRYDGNTFTVYSKSSILPHRLLGNVINDIVLDTARNMLWATTSYGGLNGIDLPTGRVVHSLPALISSGGFHNDWLKCINVCNGLIWIGTYDGLHVYNPSTRQLSSMPSIPVDGRAPDPRLNVTIIHTDRFHHVWVFFPDHGLAVYNGLTHTLLRFFSCRQLSIHETQSYLQSTGRVAQVNDTCFLLATDHGFKQISYDSALQKVSYDKALRVNELAGKQVIGTCAMDKNGKLWFSISNHLYTFDEASGRYREVKDISRNREGNWLNAVFFIHFDDWNNVWLGTQQGAALARNAPPPFIPYAEGKPMVKINHVNYVFPQDDSTLLACAPDGLYQVNTASDEIRQPDRSCGYKYIFRHPDGHIILSNEKGLFIYQAGGHMIPVEQYYPELKPIRHEVINSAVFPRDGAIIMGSETNNGIYVWYPREHRLAHLPLRGGISTNTIVNTIYQDSRDHTWVLLDNAIVILDEQHREQRRWQPVDPDLKIPLSILFDVCEAGGSYWLAVYGKGVVQLDSNLRIRKIYADREGMLNTGVYKVFPYRDSLVFTTSNNGLYSIDIRNKQVQQYLKDDGLHSNSFEENSGYLDNKLFYAGGVGGFSVIDPALIRDNHTPPVLYINHLSIRLAQAYQDTFNLGWKAVRIPHNALQTTVSFSAINYSNPTRTVFAYRIKELGGEWVQLGLKNFVDLIGLDPGSYTLEVKAANENLVWSQPQAITLEFMPKWYQTWWFKLLLYLCIALVLYAIYYNRISQLRKQQLIRKNIASDLHDDIGSTLNSVKICTHMALRESKQPELLLQIETSLQQATTGIRDMIWVLDDSQDTVGELLERIKKFALPITLASNIAFRIVPEVDNNQQISKSEKRNLLLLAKEAINNSVKYAACTTIILGVALRNGKLLFTIRDDGKGFDMQAVSSGEGLKNMHERCRQINYRCHVATTPQGTVISFAKK